MSIRLDWEGKPTRVERISLPFQTVETINESRASRERDAGSLLSGSPEGRSPRNLLVWGDNKLVMSSLLNEYAGKLSLVYIDPPFDTGADFSYRVAVGDGSVEKGLSSRFGGDAGGGMSGLSGRFGPAGGSRLLRTS